MIAEHPDMKFSHPIHLVSEQGEIFFDARVSPAISRNSTQQELAWEFLRFCLEFECTALFVSESGLVTLAEVSYFPINRLLFENNVRNRLEEMYNSLVRLDMLPETGDEEAEETKARFIEESLQGFTNLLSKVNTENRFDLAVMYSLIYPDIYLFISGQQDVDKTLENIQNRLELYVAE